MSVLIQLLLYYQHKANFCWAPRTSCHHSYIRFHTSTDSWTALYNLFACLLAVWPTRHTSTVTPRQARLVLRWVKVHGCVTSHPGQLSLLPAVALEMTTGCGSALMPGS